jgi:hypothetical protein
LWIPWLGSLLDFGKDPLALFKNAYDKVIAQTSRIILINLMCHQYGEVFSIELFGTEMTFLCSSEGHEHFFMTPEDDYNAAAAYKYLFLNSKFARAFLCLFEFNEATSSRIT